MINFQDFGIEDNEKYLSYLRRCVQIPADASPLNILSLKQKNNIQRGYTENLVWHKFNFEGEEFFGSPLGDWDAVDWQKTFSENVEPGTIFQFVPEYLLKIWQKNFGDSLEIEEDRDYWDYILDLEKMLKIEGPKFQAFRRLKRYFENNFTYEVEEITPKIFDELLSFQSYAEKDLQERTGNEYFAENDDLNFKFALENWEKFNLFGFVVRVEGKIIAYFLNEEIDEKNIIAPFAKADYNFKGANQFSYWYNTKITLERGFLEENFTDDVGEKSLRYFKEHLYPKYMLKKYVVIYNPV